MQRFRIFVSIITQSCKYQDCKSVLVVPILRRCLSTSSCLFGKPLPRKKPRVVPEIAGLEHITFADRMHYVPGLAKPQFPKWHREVKDPFHAEPLKQEEMKLHKEKPCYIFNQRSSIEEGVQQALWLSKAVLIKGLPAQVLSLAEDYQIENQEERLQDAIKNSRLWDTTEREPPVERFCPNLLHRLLHLCGGLHARHPALAKRILAEKYNLGATWRRGEDLFQVRGQNGLLLNSVSPVPVLAGPVEIQSTADQVLETFFPIAPTIDLQCTYVYQEKNDTGFRKDYPYPHAHTVFLMEQGHGPKLRPKQLQAKMIMFSFGNALVRARALHGNEPQVLEKPIVVQSIATNGNVFHFSLFQLNTTELQSDSGVKNQVWLDADQELYSFVKDKPVIKKKIVKCPAGIIGFQPETFKKFLALYLHGA